MDSQQSKTHNRRGFIATAGVMAGIVIAALPHVTVAQGNTVSKTRQVGDKAWNRFRKAWETGEWQPFLDMLTDDFTFWFPEGEFRGRYSGRQGKEKVVAWANYHRQERNRVRTIPTYVSVGENTVVFENESESIPPGTYKNWEAVVFEVREDKISGLREYWGNLQP